MSEQASYLWAAATMWRSAPTANVYLDSVSDSGHFPFLASSRISDDVDDRSITSAESWNVVGSVQSTTSLPSIASAPARLNKPHCFFAANTFPVPLGKFESAVR